MFAAKEVYAELVALSYSQRGGGGLLVRNNFDGCGHALDENHLQISEFSFSFNLALV
jgi:hypothetical protein